MSEHTSNHIEQGKMAHYELNIYTDQEASQQHIQTNCCTVCRENEMPHNTIHIIDEKLNSTKCSIKFEKLYQINYRTKQEIRRCVKSLNQKNMLLPTGFTPFFAREQMSLHRIGRGKESKHFPIILLKFFRTTYNKQFDDSSIVITSNKLGLQNSHIKALSRLLKSFSTKIPAPRKILKNLEKSDSFLLLLLYPAMRWLELEHTKITEESKKYEYKKYFSQIVHYICFKLQIMDDYHDFDEDDGAEE